MTRDVVRIAILAPTLAVRIGLRTLLGEVETIEVIAEASDFPGLVESLDGVDTIVLQGEVPIGEWDPSLDRGSQLAFLWITDNPQATATLRGIPGRAWGIVSTDATEEDLLAALFAVNQGFIVAAKQALEPYWLEPASPADDSLIETLTPRESEVLQLLAQGLANKQIAFELEISEHTVKFHISSIYGKLGATNRTEAVRFGLRLGLIIL